MRPEIQLTQRKYTSTETGLEYRKVKRERDKMKAAKEEGLRSSART